MQQKIEQSCSCIGNLFNPHEKLFLVRKKDLEEPDPPILGRVNNSSEGENQSEAKPQKKSLKKRPLSNHSADHSAPLTPTETPKTDKFSIGFDPIDPQFCYSKPETHVHSATFVPNFVPLPTDNSHSLKKKSYNYISEHRYYHPELIPQFYNPMTSRAVILQQTLRQIGPQNQNHPIQRQPPSSHQTQQFNQHYHSTSIQNVQKAQLPYRQERESWYLPKEESLIIEGFDRLFNNEEYHTQDKPLRAREAHRSRRFQKQKLTGRFAESDDENASQDPPSEVIGKGFDGRLHDFWQEEGNHVKETYASRSTNTKFSEMQRVTENSDLHSPSHTHQRSKFGTGTNFKSYKFL